MQCHRMDFKTKKIGWAVGMWAIPERSEGLSIISTACEGKTVGNFVEVIHRLTAPTTGFLIQVTTGIRCAGQFIRESGTIYS